MEADDPRTPLLGPRRRRIQRATAKLCSLEAWRRRAPITIWLPKYNLEYLLRDCIAGITVGLTSIPQGIAYAIVAGLPPQVGLYSSIFPGLVYMIFGSCKDVTVGPTAILAALLAKYVSQSEDFAYLAAFLSGCVILLLGVLQLGFLLDFISRPVISGFTTAAALQIGASQLRSLFRVTGSSGGTFVDAVVNFFRNIKTVHPWDTLLGIASIFTLVILKRTTIKTSPSERACRAWRARLAAGWRYVARARNALVVCAGAALASALSAAGRAPLALTGTIEGGLPRFGPPPFSTVVNNRTLNFEEMLSVFGAEGLVMPLVAILESIAIAKAFAGSASVDATQEMIAVGACNIFSSFCQAMPATGSFTRTALNHASGVVTPAGCFFKASLVLLAVTFLAPAFYFIPRCVLAAVIIVAMASLIEYAIVRQLWRHSKVELAVYCVTVAVGVGAGLEYGILAGAGGDALRALARQARPQARADAFKVGNVDCTCVALVGALSYAAAGHVARLMRKCAEGRAHVVVLDGRQLYALDIGVAENLVAACVELEKGQLRVLLWNFPERVCRMLEEMQPGFGSRLVSGPSIDQHILNLDIDRRNIANHTVY